MLHLKHWLLVSGLALAVSNTHAQDTKSTSDKIAGITQKIHGIVTDAASKQPIAGVVVLLQSNTNINAVTNDNGYFEMANVPVGRQTFVFKMVGFEDYTVPQAMVISGKTLDLNISMSESLRTLKEVTVKTTAKDRIKPMI